jgi:hypothetical protein
MADSTVRQQWTVGMDMEGYEKHMVGRIAVKR